MALRQVTSIGQVAVLLSACVLGLAACGGGSPGGDDDGGGAPMVREDDLELGGIDPVPADVPASSGDDLEMGRALEAERIAELVVDPVTIDPRFQEVGLPTGAMASPDQLTRMFASEDPKLFKDRVSGGVATRRFTPDGVGVSSVVLTFDTPALASRFAKVVGDKNETDRIEPITKMQTYGERTSLPGHPGARASLYTVSRDDKDPSLIVVTSRGAAVLYMFSTAPAGQVGLAKQLVGKLLTEQLEALERLEPLRLVDMLDQEVEGRAMRNLTLAHQQGAEDAHVWLWGPTGALHQQSTAGELAQAFERADLDAMAQGGGNVYRTGSPAKARRLQEAMIEAALVEDYEEGFTPKGLRDATCLDVKEDSSILVPYCIVTLGRYVLEAGGATPNEAQARISAQYLVVQEATR